MEDLKNRLTSRKFWLTVVGVLSLVGLVISGNMEVELAAERIMVLIGTYVGIEGATDVARTLKGGAR